MPLCLKRGYKRGCEYHGGDLLEAADAPASYQGIAEGGRSTKILAGASVDWPKN